MSSDATSSDAISSDNLTRLAVGYLATPSGNDGVALAVAVAQATGAAIDLICVVKPVPYDGHPGLDQYQERLENQAAEWLAEGANLVPDGIELRTVVTVNEAFSDGIVEVAEQSGAAMIIVGGTGDGILSRHTLGTVSTELLHSSPLPVLLAPRGYAGRTGVKLDMITVAVPLKENASDPLPFALGLAELAHLDLRLMSLVSIEAKLDDETNRQAREYQVSVAQELLAKTRESVAPGLDVDVVVADGDSLDDALDNLRWDQNDLVAVGSGHLGEPQRVFLGSTAARILRWTTAPVLVVPKS